MKEITTDLSTAQTLAGTRSFQGVSIDALKALANCAEIRVYPGGSHLFRPGDKYKKSVFILLKGAIIMHRPTGRQDPVMPGDFIGLANYLDNNDYTTKSEVTSQSHVLEISEENLKRLEDQYPELFNALNRIIAAKLRERSPDRSISSGVLAQPVTRVMKSPVSSCSPETTLKQALDLMLERKIGSLVVTDESNRLQGVLTFSGLAKASILQGAGPQDRVMDITHEMPRVIDPDTPLWEAEEIQKRHNAKYLLVLEDHVPIGMVSQSDILRVLISRPSTLTTRFRDAGSIKELSTLVSNLNTVATDAQTTNHRPSDAVRLLSETHLIIQRRAVELTLRWMERKGHGKPPVDFALLIMGSGGRKEMLLNPDQDNGIIIEDHPEGDALEVQAWFDTFCKRINRNLGRVGYPLCPGDIMASNPLYHKTLSRWKKQISHITKKPTEKAARWSNVMFDFDTLYGNDALTAELRHHTLSELQKRPRLLKMMADDDAEGRPAIGFFNQLITTTSNEFGKWIDIKRNGLRIVADAARIFALQNGIAVQNTTDRLEALVRIGKLSKDFKDSIQEAYEELLDLLLTHQIQQYEAGKKLDKLIAPEQLSDQTRSTLRMAMRAIKRLQEQLQAEFGADQLF